MSGASVNRGRAAAAARPLSSSSSDTGSPSDLLEEYDSDSEFWDESPEEEPQQNRNRCETCANKGNVACRCAKIDTWAEANFHPLVQANIARAQCHEPRPIQKYVIPAVQAGKDVKCRAKAGSGMSASYLLPIVDSILKRKQSGEISSRAGAPFALVLEPTREICAYQEFQAKKFTHGTGVTVARAYGGHFVTDDFKQIYTHGCDILIATPGRAMHLMLKALIIPDNLAFLVMDEADKVLDENFEDDKSKRQTIVLSSTFGFRAWRTSQQFLRADYTDICRNDPSISQRVALRIFKVPKEQKIDRMVEFLTDELERVREREPTGAAEPKIACTLVFVRTKQDAKKVVFVLNKFDGLTASAMNADLDQKSREQTLTAFVNGDVRILVTTDVLARGLQFPGLRHMVNMDLPDDYDTYVHRKGRVGRKFKGTLTNFFDPDSASDKKLAIDLVVELMNNSKKTVPSFISAAAFEPNHSKW